MLKRIRSALGNASSAVRGLRKDDKGVVMVEWVALAGIFVAVLVVTFLAIGEKASTVVETVDTQLGTITSNIGSGTTTTTSTGG